MEVIESGQEMDERRKAFFQLVFGSASGYVCIAFLDVKMKNFREEFFRYPEDVDSIVFRIQANLRGNNVYFCPQLLREKKRIKESVIITPSAWADLDSCRPDLLEVVPTTTVETSPGRYQAYWRLDNYDPDEVEDLSRRIAYKHADDGADVSGWDLTQLLRVPYTYNYKYTRDNVTPVVKIIDIVRAQYRMQDFSTYPESPEYSKVDIPYPAEGDLPGEGSGENVLQSRRKVLNPLIWPLYTEPPDTGKWSQQLWRLMMMAFESGFNRMEVFVIARDAACNKFARDGRPIVQLWKDVCRAEAKSDLHAQLLVPDIDTMVPLLTEEEKRLVLSAEDTFVERYQAWATGLGDAAPQYHQAGAFVVLSSLLAGTVRLPTSFGTIVPNLWFMILADTTLTRKSTAMDIAMDLVMDIDDDVLMATDGSLEGLLGTLAGRVGRPSVFLRDEFSGLLEQMTKKDYMAGMPEMFTKLYDGKMQKRVLKKEVIEVRDPRLIIFAGGIKNKITSLLTLEMVSSGFMPRFVFITAESDLDRVRPIGPPTTMTTGDRDVIIAELTDMKKHYERTQVLRVTDMKADVVSKVLYDAELTEEAWIRYNKLESDLLEAGMKDLRPEVMTPVGDRLSKSILKAAMLIAASRQKEPASVNVELIDILRAIRYGEQWKAHGQEVMDNIGKSTAERQLDNIVATVNRNPGGISRSKIMQNYHLTARDTTYLFETLEQRGMISRQRAGKTELILPTAYGIQATEGKR